MSKETQQRYGKSEPFDVTTLGLTGAIKLIAEKEKNKSEEVERDSEVLEFSAVLSMCPHPYSLTKVIKIVPKYILICNLEFPLAIKPFTGGKKLKNETLSPFHQNVLSPGQHQMINLEAKYKGMI